MSRRCELKSFTRPPERGNSSTCLQDCVGGAVQHHPARQSTSLHDKIPGRAGKPPGSFVHSNQRRWTRDTKTNSGRHWDALHARTRVRDVKRHSGYLTGAGAIRAWNCHTFNDYFPGINANSTKKPGGISLSRTHQPRIGSSALDCQRSQQPGDC